MLGLVENNLKFKWLVYLCSPEGSNSSCLFKYVREDLPVKGSDGEEMD